MKRRLALGLGTLALISGGLGAGADDRPAKIKGYFCDSRADQVSFLTKQAAGENEIMAANAVNKALGRQSCADYVSVKAIFKSEKTVMANGLVFKMQSFVFLPEKVERWTGSVFGSLQQSADQQDT